MGLPKELKLHESQDFERKFLNSFDPSQPRTRRKPKRFECDSEVIKSTDLPNPTDPPSSPSAASDLSASPSEASTTDMSQRSRNPRDRARNTGHDNGEETAIWNEVQPKVNKLAALDARFKDISSQIFAMEETIKSRKDEGIQPSTSEIQQLDQLYRTSLKITEDMKELLNEDVMGKVQILKVLVDTTEQEASARASNSRDSHSRSAMDLDGPNDSPGPSPAENKHVRKLGVGRPSSQPPRDKEKDTSEPSESSNNPGRTKITFALGAEVAFKPKIPGQTEEHDWIQGIVVKVIGEGKSRRYDVQDPFPDDPSKPGAVYRSSASSMVPIPPTGSPLGPYEAGRQVLALYPETTTFYRAEVKAMQDNGSKVQLLFEDDAQGMRIVDRRFVLDHKG